MQRSIFLVFVVWGLGWVNADQTCPQGTVDDAKASQAALADFAVNFHKSAASKKAGQNVITSPVSVALALALLESGAAGATRDRIKAVLAGQGATTDVLRTYAALHEQLTINERLTVLTVANGIFPHKTVPVTQSFLAAVEGCFHGEVDTLDFAGQLQRSRRKINQFVSNKTAGKIPELFKADSLDTDTLLVLANAIYFKGAWASEFPQASTAPATFHRSGRDQDTQTVPFMSHVARHGYSTEDASVSVLELPYTRRELALYVLLPKSRDGLAALEQQLTGQRLHTLTSGLASQWVRATLPKFSTRTSVDLAETLRELDLAILFRDQADFTRMTQVPTKVTKAVHEAYIKVHENGTEAAAASGFAFGPRSGPPNNPPEFTADHPFLYAIKHNPTGAFLFLGKVNFVEDQEN